MIKSRRLAYDGRGNAVANSEDEIPAAVDGNYFFNRCIFFSFFEEKGRTGKIYL